MNIKSLLSNHGHKILLGIIFAILFLAPFFWTMTIGGDDGKFYYVFPQQFLKNFSIENIYNDLGSFNPQHYILPFSLLLFLCQKIFFFLNIQKLFFGLNLSCSFLFFYLLLGLFGNNKSGVVKITSSLLYSLSIFSYYTVWNYQLFSMYLVSVFPLVLYLFLKSVKENKIGYLIMASLVLSLFSIVTLSLPWFVALFIAALPLMAIFFWSNKTTCIKHFFVFIVLFFLLNVYWIVGFILTSGSGGILHDIVSSDFRQQNVALIQAVSSYNSVLYPFFNLFHKNIQIDYNWHTKDIYINYLVKLLPLNFLFLIMVILPVFFYKKADINDKKLYTTSLLSWLTILFLYTVNIGTWGLPVFIWLTNTIPGFVMFRNMYDKFAIALSFSYALLLFISLKITYDNVKIKEFKKHIISLLLVVLIAANAYPFLSGAFYNLPIWTTKNTYPKIHDFNKDFYALTNYIATIKTSSKFLWLPLNQAGYIVISDSQNKNYYYNGISLLKTLSGKNDYSGTLNFNNHTNGDIQQYIAKKEYEKLFDLLGKFNIEYVIVNKDINKELQNSYLYGYLATGDLYTNQMSPDFLNGILGEKIEDFGDRYSLYKINDVYVSKTLDANNIEFQKINNNQYHIYIKNVTSQTPLTFLSHYSKFWYLFLKPNPNDIWCTNKTGYALKDSEYYKVIECQPGQNSFREELTYLWEKPIFDETHKTIYGYANQWSIDTEYIKKNFDKSYYKENPDGSIDIELTLYFKPQLYFYLGLIVSGITLLGCFGYLCWYFMRKRKIDSSLQSSLKSKETTKIIKIKINEKLD